MKRLTQKGSGLSPRAFAALANLSTPIAIQNFLDRTPMNWEKKGETLQSPARVLKSKKAHCFEGALLAAAALWIAGEPPLIMNLSSRMGRGDMDHVIALYKRGNRFGAISKTNHATIRFRDPIYKTLRELALSYFHEWFLNSTGEKTLECYSQVYDLSRKGAYWVAAPHDLWELDNLVSRLPHHNLVPKGNWRYVRKADRIETEAGKLIEWKKSDRRT